MKKAIEIKESEQIIQASVDVDVVSEFKHETPFGSLNDSYNSMRV